MNTSEIIIHIYDKFDNYFHFNQVQYFHVAPYVNSFFLKFLNTFTMSNLGKVDFQSGLNNFQSLAQKHFYNDQTNSNYQRYK